MKVLHCAWIPESTSGFFQQGDFWLWAESGVAGAEPNGRRHPRHLPKAELIAFLENPLGLSISPYERRFHFVPRVLSLPTADGRPLPAPEFDHGGDAEPPPSALRAWEVDAYRLVRPIRQLGELRFLAYYHGPETRPGGDLLFWHY